MFNSLMTASNIRKVADKIEFGHAVVTTEDPVTQARAVATYKRLDAESKRVLAALDEDDQLELLSRARIEVAQRRFMRREDAKAKRARREELAAMKADLDL